MIESAALPATTVELSGPDDEVYHVLSDEDGRFSFSGLRPGKYELKIFDDNLPELHAFDKDTYEFELKTGGQEIVEIRVLPIVRPIQIIQLGEVKVRTRDRR